MMERYCLRKREREREGKCRNISKFKVSQTWIHIGREGERNVKKRKRE